MVFSPFRRNFAHNMEDFIHLHVHTYYSILDGQSSIKRLVDKAVANGMRGMAITDHGDMFGIKDTSLCWLRIIRVIRISSSWLVIRGWTAIICVPVPTVLI